jgi:hypothetical protein
MRMINGEMFKSHCIHILKTREQFTWISVIICLRCWRCILERINLFRAILFASDESARFIRRIVFGLRDDLLKMKSCKNHFRFPICDLRLLDAEIRDAAIIAVSSFASFNREFTNAGFIAPLSTINSIQNALSSASSSTTPSLAMNSYFERPRHAAR